MLRRLWRHFAAFVYADEDGPEVRPVLSHERGMMANSFREGDYIIIKQQVLSGTNSDETTRVFHINQFYGGSMARGFLVSQGPQAEQDIDWQDDIERRADPREVQRAQGRAPR